jgi:hypothetical protein
MTRTGGVPPVAPGMRIFWVSPFLVPGMFRPFRKREREIAPSNETGHRRVLHYGRPEAEEKPRRGFWPDREGWKDLIGTLIAELIVVPLLVIAALLIWFCFFHG